MMIMKNNILPESELLLLGVDGGGTQCRARLTDGRGTKLAEAVGGPANVRFGLEESLAAVFDAGARCLEQAGLSARDLPRIFVCLALAGVSEPSYRVAAQRHPHPYRDAVVTTDAQAACIGAHAGRDGGVVIVGTGSIGWAELGGRHIRIGGWGAAVSDEGSGAWLGCEALRRVLWAHDGRIAWSGLLMSLFEKFDSDPHAIVRWSAGARPRKFAGLAPAIVNHAAAQDPVAVELIRMAASHVDALAGRLVQLGAHRLALMGGLAGPIEPWLTQDTRGHLIRPQGDALDGALRLAAAAAGLKAFGDHEAALEDRR